MAVSREEIEALKTRKKSVLYPFLDDLLSMREAGVSFKGIQSWLREQNVETSTENIRLFCKRNKIFNPNGAKVKRAKRAQNIYVNVENKGSKITFLSEEKGI